MSAAGLSTAAAATDIVLLHGWGLTPAVWAPMRSLLGGRRSSAPALPGHAGAAAANAATLAAWSEHLAARLAPAATLVGWSLGAMLALDLAHRYPARVARLVLIGGTARFVADDASPAAWPGLAPATVEAFRSGFARDPHATLKRFVALQCLGEADRRCVQTQLGAALTALDIGEQGDEHRDAHISPPAAPTRAVTPTDRAPVALADGLALLAGSDLRATLAQIEQPCLLIHGEHDALMPVAAARAMAHALPASRLEILQGSGHALPLSRSAACARLIAEFWDA
jgi:pimeloyl-[acyl-carrier protein] methyl ester esterase